MSLITLHLRLCLTSLVFYITCRPQVEAYHMKTTVKVLPMLRDVKQRLAVLSSGIVRGSDLQPPHELTRLLATVKLKAVDDIKVNDVWCAVCALYPELSSFIFMAGDGANNTMISGESLARRMVAEYVPTSSISTTNLKHHTLIMFNKDDL